MKRYVTFSIPDIPDSYIPVKHRQGSGDETPPKGFSSWKDFWQTRTGKFFGLCACEDCSEPATDGAHVILAGESDRRWYIVPMCHQCNTNKNKESFRVKKVLLVPVSDK